MLHFRKADVKLKPKISEIYLSKSHRLRTEERSQKHTYQLLSVRVSSFLTKQQRQCNEAVCSSVAVQMDIHIYKKEPKHKPISLTKINSLFCSTNLCN